MNGVYLITFDKEEARVASFKDNYSDVKDVLEVAWSRECSKEEASMVFDEMVRKAAQEYRSNESNNKKWRTIRLWNPNGVQLKQES